MAVNSALRSLDIDIPAQPTALVKLSLLLAEEGINMASASALIEADMALAAAVIKAVNTSMYGLKGRVQSVHQAITYLGIKEVAAVSFEMGLRAAFPPTSELQPLWQRAALRGALMSRLAQRLGLDAWAAHSAGLFEECGKAVLFRHAPDHYRAMLRASKSDQDLVTMERTGFGVSHEALGAALCEGWGLDTSAVLCVRHHVAVQAGQPLPEEPAARALSALSGIAQAALGADPHLEDKLQHLCAQAGLEAPLVRRNVQQWLDQQGQQGQHGQRAGAAQPAKAGLVA